MIESTSSKSLSNSEEVDLENQNPVVAAAVEPHQKSKSIADRDPFEFSMIICGGSALAFNAGFVNGCTYQFRNIPGFFSHS